MMPLPELTASCLAQHTTTSHATPDTTDPTTLVTTWLHSASSTLTLPDTPPVIAPDPRNNPWHIIGVGQPIWLTVQPPTTQTTTTTHQGIQLTLTATPVGSTTWDFHDGTTLTCAHMTPRPSTADPMAPSPDCGHTYLHVGTYTITATTTWNVTWTALNRTGTITTPRTSTKTITVAELHSVVTGH